jgi:hypothetical protein
VISFLRISFIALTEQNISEVRNTALLGYNVKKDMLSYPSVGITEEYNITFDSEEWIVATEYLML